MPKQSPVDRVQLIQDLHGPGLVALPNVLGVATGFRQRRGRWTDEIAVQVFVSRKFPSDHLPDGAIVPADLSDRGGERIRTDVIDAGFFQPLQDTTRYRPVVGGCSIGNLTGINAGTLGGWAGDQTDDTVVFLTNNHVVTGIDRTVIPGNSGIVQPGQFDGGASPADLIGQTKRLIPIPTAATMAGAPTTVVDAAVGTISVDRRDNIQDVAPAIYEIAAPTLGMNVQKRGRTTRLTTNGQIVSINASWTLNYGTPQNARFATIGTGGSVFNIASTDGNPFGNRGDSGSLIFSQQAGELEGTLPVVGLLFAGGGFPFGALIGACGIDSVFNQLNLTTLCNLYMRSFLEAIFGTEESGAMVEVSASSLRRKEYQLRRLRDDLKASGPLGELGVELFSSRIPDIARTLSEDDESFALALRTFGPWVRKRTNLDVLESVIDEETVRNFDRLARRIGRVNRNLREPANLLRTAVAASKGERISDLLKSPAPRLPRPRRQRKR